MNSKKIPLVILFSFNNDFLMIFSLYSSHMDKEEDRHTEKHFSEKHLTQVPPWDRPWRTSLAVKHREETGVGMNHAHTSPNTGHKIQMQQPILTPAEAMAVTEHQVAFMAE